MGNLEKDTCFDCICYYCTNTICYRGNCMDCKDSSNKIQDKAECSDFTEEDV